MSGKVLLGIPFFYTLVTRIKDMMKNNKSNENFNKSSH